MATLRAYTVQDYDAIINLFLLNTPQFFCPPEQQDLEAFLRDELENYYVVEENGEILACGGSNIEDGIGWLSWYIVHPASQGKGYGKQVALKNLELLKADERVGAIKVRTSQLVYPFYEKLGFVLRSTRDNYWGQGMHLYEMDLNTL